jgi:hypothetical protein
MPAESFAATEAGPEALALIETPPGRPRPSGVVVDGGTGKLVRAAEKFKARAKVDGDTPAEPTIKAKVNA